MSEAVRATDLLYLPDPPLPDKLDTLIGWLLALSVGLVGLDEFNVNLGLFSLKAAMVPLAIATVIAATKASVGYRLPPIRNYPIVLFCFYIFVQAYMHFLNWPDILPNPNMNLNPNGMYALSKPFNLYMLLFFAYMGSSYMTLKQMRAGLILLLFLQCCKFMLCLHYIMSGDFLKIWWSGSGLPRFTLVKGGMTANQMGGIWLVCFIGLFFMNAARKLSKWNFLLILIAAVGAVSSQSRSMMIGMMILLIMYALVRRKVILVMSAAILCVVGVGAFVIMEPHRVADASALSRLTFWAYSFDDFMHNMLLGSGFGTNPAPHSVWFQLLSETGMIGFPLAIMALLQIFFRPHVTPKFSLSLMAMIFMPYAFFLSVDIPLQQWQTWVLIIIANIAIRNYLASRPDPAIPEIPSVSVCGKLCN